MFLYILALAPGAYTQDSSLPHPLLEQAQKHYAKGKEYSAQGDYVKANEEFKKAEELLKGASVREYQKKVEIPYEEIRDTLDDARQAAATENHELAAKLYLEALVFFPENPDIHYNLALQYLALGNWWEAARQLLWVIRLDPEHADAYYNLGILYEIFLNDNTLAATYYQKYLTLYPDAPEEAVVQGWIEDLLKKTNERR